MLFPLDIFRPQDFDLWVKENRKRLVKTATRWVGENDAENCVQNAKIAAWQSLSRLPEQCSLSQFLQFMMRKLRDACRAHIRQSISRNEVLMEPHEILSLVERMSTDATIPLPDMSHPGYCEFRQLLLELMPRAGLTSLQELCIRKWMNGSTQTEIADFLQVKQPTVKGHISAGVAKLRTLAKQEEPVEQKIRDEFWWLVEQVELSIYHAPCKSREKVLYREKPERKAA